MYSYSQTCHRVDTALALPNYGDIPEPSSMANSYLTGSQLDHSTIHFFKRRERLPLSEKLWFIEAGAVRTYTLIDDGTIITLGFWERGDTVGQPLAYLQPYEVECLTDIKVRVLQPHECWNLNQLLSSAVFARATYQLFTGASPEALTMGIVGVVALLANLLCLLLLTRHRNDNLNMSSVWLCSRNDIIANTSVLAAAALVSLTHSLLPDLAVGLLLTFIFVRSAGKVLSQSWREMQQA